jgi:anti-sigma-K factor RskA
VNCQPDMRLAHSLQMTNSHLPKQLLSAIADYDVEVTAVLADRVHAVAPPPMMLDQLLRAIGEHRNLVESSEMSKFAVERPPVADPVTTGSSDAPDCETPKRNWRRTMFALVASIAVFGGLALGASGLIRAAAPQPDAVIALEQIESSADANAASTSYSGGEATVHWSAEVGKVVLVADGLPQLSDDRTFELWFVRGETPIPAGTFDAADGIGTALFSVGMEQGDLVAVTIEQSGGSPDGLPTTDAILAIATG